jgi:predicted DNA-binding protein with PD1-like motif
MTLKYAHMLTYDFSVSLLKTAHPMQTIVFRLQPDSDLRQSLLDYCIAHEITAAFVLSCVGSLRIAEIRFAGCSDSTHFDEKLEILSLAGTLSPHGCHLHIVISNKRGQVTGGHLMNGSHIYTTAEIILGVLPDMTFGREHDPVTGYKELNISTSGKPQG